MDHRRKLQHQMDTAGPQRHKPQGHDAAGLRTWPRAAPLVASSQGWCRELRQRKVNRPSCPGNAFAILRDDAQMFRSLPWDQFSHNEDPRGGDHLLAGRQTPPRHSFQPAVGLLTAL